MKLYMQYLGICFFFVSTPLWKNIYTGLFFAVNGFYVAVILFCAYDAFGSAVLQWIKSPYTSCTKLLKGRTRGRNNSGGDSRIELKTTSGAKTLVATPSLRSLPASPRAPPLRGTKVGNVDSKLETVNPLHA